MRHAILLNSRWEESPNSGMKRILVEVSRTLRKQNNKGIVRRLKSLKVSFTVPKLTFIVK